MTTPANENTYDQAGDSAICKGAPQASRANPPSFASAQAAAKGRCSDVLHDRVLGPDDREGETPAERYRRAARAKAQQSAHDAEAVEGTENPGEQEGKGHGGDLASRVAHGLHTGPRGLTAEAFFKLSPSLLRSLA